MNKRTLDRTLALAALAQASDCVYQLATEGNCSEEHISCLTNSLFIFDAESTEAIYGDVKQLEVGLKIIQALSSGKHDKKRSAEVIKYGFSLLHLENKLKNKPEMLSIIRSRFEHIQLKKDHFSSGDNLSAEFAAISALYQDSLSTFRFRIQVNGKVQYLQQAPIADKIRSLLFAGVRAAMLWRQLGGKQWVLLFQRKQLYDQAQYWLDHIHQSDS